MELTWNLLQSKRIVPGGTCASTSLLFRNQGDAAILVLSSAIRESFATMKSVAGFHGYSLEGVGAAPWAVMERNASIARND